MLGSFKWGYRYRYWYVFFWYGSRCKCGSFLAIGGILCKRSWGSFKGLRGEYEAGLELVLIRITWRFLQIRCPFWGLSIEQAPYYFGVCTKAPDLLKLPPGLNSWSPILKPPVSNQNPLFCRTPIHVIRNKQIMGSGCLKSVYTA